MNETLFAAASAALAAGFFGSAHCLGMCGGISGLFAVRLEVASLSRRLRLALVYNLGRISGYALIGFLAAGIGRTIAGIAPMLAGSLRLIAGFLIILVGVQIAFNWKPLDFLERGGASVWKHIAPTARNLLPVTSASRALALGFLWGWLPCGLVYSALLIAATTGDALHGAWVMIAFGLGTLPMMLLTGMGAAEIQAFMARTWARRGAGLLVVAMGLATVWMPILKLVAAGSPHAQH